MSVYIIFVIMWEIINEVFKNCLIYMRNNVQYVYYSISKKQKKYIYIF